MAKAKAVARKAGPKNELPKGFKAITSGDFAPSWDFEKQPVIEGVLKEKRTITQNKGKKDEREVAIWTIATKSGDVAVWESYSLKALHDVKKGKRVAVVFNGYRPIKGRKQPMKDFTVGVA
jgi:hypothetical protein